MPDRIQRKRTKGWRMPPDTVYVGRGSRWGNPFVVGKDGTAAECVKKYGAMMLPYTHQPPNNGLTELYVSLAILESMEELRGKNLACWCAPGEPCHGDLLLDIANSPL